MHTRYVLMTGREVHLEEVLKLGEIEVDLRLVLGPDGALLGRLDLVPVQLLQPPRLYLQQARSLFCVSLYCSACGLIRPWAL